MEKYPDREISVKEATWVFVSASEKEHRHLLDIVWGIESLRTRGVPDENISIFQDNPDFAAHLAPFKMDHLVKKLGDFPSANFKVGPTKACFFVFTGHGAIDGLYTPGLKLSPIQMFQKMRKIDGLERGFLIIGQCFGGIFEGLNASEKPEIGVMAATKLHFSYSHPFPLLVSNTQVKNSAGEILPAWGANVFLFHFFQWVRAPIDVDGDGKITLLDAYKYSGSKTNVDLTEIRFGQSLDALGQIEAEKQKIRDHYSKKKELQNVELETSLNKVKEYSLLLHLHTEPWILHAHLIRSTLIA